MNQNDFILLNAGVVTLVVIYLAVARRKPAQPVSLRMHDRDVKTPAPLTTAKPEGPRAAPSMSQGRERALNITFVFDDRTHDAFEVLQIPAGSSTAAAQIAFNTLSGITRAEQLPLLRAALAAIQKS